MQGLELSRAFYHEVCAPMLAGLFPGLAGRAAAGLVGEGSECLGFDDELSRDHDWGAAVRLWLTGPDYARYGEELRAACSRLPPAFRGFPVLMAETGREKPPAVMAIGDFYYRYLGRGHAPRKNRDWLAVPEAHLCAAANGEVFADPLGEFTRIREDLLAFYPEDVRRVKISACCARMAQAGQYNFPRCRARGQNVAALLAESAFIEAACGAVFLLCRRYAPFYKWLHRALADLPPPGARAHALLAALAAALGGEKEQTARKTELIEEICAVIAGELRSQGLSGHNGDFMLDHAYAVRQGVEDGELKNMNILLG